MLVYNSKSVIFFLIVFLFASCSNGKTDSKNKRKLNNSISQTSPKLQMSNHYIFYLPQDEKVEGILVIMDPHGKPNLVLDSLHSLADKEHLALLGLKDIENGISNYNTIINRDLQHFISYKNLQNKKVFLIGFSGAARMALNYSSRNRINGLIVCGAGLQRQTSLPFPTVMMSGLSDFNFMEQYYTPNNPRTFDRNSIAIHFKGKHQWPTVLVLNDAIQFVVNRNNGNGNSKSQYYIDLSKKYYTAKEYFLSFKSMEVAYKLSSGENVEKTRKMLIDLSNDSRIKIYFQRQNKYIAEEQKRYQMLSESIEIQNLKWWNNQINYMEVKSKSNKNELEAESYSRTIAYMGILMYSRLNAVSAGRGHFDLFPKYLAIYEKLEPQNPDLYFFKGIYAYTQGNQQEAKQDLQKSLQLGFTDKGKMRKFFSQDFLIDIL
jgi:hypothetical protein